MATWWYVAPRATPRSFESLRIVSPCTPTSAMISRAARTISASERPAPSTCPLLAGISGARAFFGLGGPRRGARFDGVVMAGTAGTAGMLRALDPPIVGPHDAGHPTELGLEA